MSEPRKLNPKLNFIEAVKEWEETHPVEIAVNVVPGDAAVDEATTKTAKKAAAIAKKAVG